MVKRKSDLATKRRRARADYDSGIKYVKRALREKKPIEVVKDYDTVGVRFIFGAKADKVYTYKVQRPYNVTHLYLGALLVATTPHPNGGDHMKRVCCIVEIHSDPQDTDRNIEYKFINERVAPL